MDGGSVRRKAATYTQNNTDRIKAHRHPCLEWDAMPMFERSKRVHALDRAAAVIGRSADFTALYIFRLILNQ
jgi:hypothetical protein